jgi:hypothetical protein
MKASIDTQYAGYIDIYTTFDQLIWAIPAVLAAVLTFGFGLLGNVVGSGVKVMPFTHEQTVGILYLAVGLFVAASVYAMARIRKHHTLVGEHLQKLESPGGYFATRNSIVQRWLPPAAPYVFIVAFGAIAVIFGTIGILLLGGLGTWGVPVLPGVSPSPAATTGSLLGSAQLTIEWPTSRW